MSVATRNEFSADFSAVQATMRLAVVPGYASKKDTHWKVWVAYCTKLGFDPYLQGVEDPIPILQVFGHRYHNGSIAPRGKPVQSQAVSDAIRSVGQRFAALGADDPRLNSVGKLQFRLQRQIRGYSKLDAPKHRVKPLPICVVLSILKLTFSAVSPSSLGSTCANMICLGFFFCLRPGEYTGTTSDDQAFALEDVGLFLGLRRLSLQEAQDFEILSATKVTLTFTKQKNANNGQIIAHARSGNPSCCPVVAVIRQIMHHRQQCRHFHRAYDGTVKLASFYTPTGRNVPLRAASVTKVIRLHAALCQHLTGVPPADYSARSLRAGGAMALMAGGCDSNVIKLLGRWRSDAMMDYLHEQSLPVFRKLSKLMFNNGEHSFLPEETVPIAD